MEKITVLMTGAGAPGAFGIIRCLRNNGERDIRLIGVDANPEAGCKELVDAFEVVPMAASEEFIPRILEVCKKYHVDVVQPIVTRELQKFAENRQLFADNGIQVCVSDPDKLKIINNKGNLFEYLKGTGGFKLPEYYIVHSLPEYQEAMEKLDWKHSPVCIKATFGNGSRGIRYVDPSKNLYDLFMKEKPDSKYISYDGMMDILKNAPEFPELMVMQFLPGKEYSADILTDRGEVKYIACRYSSVVQNSISMVSETVRNEDLENQCRYIAEKLQLSGNIGFDFRCDENGYPYLMEINPRLTATVVLNAVAGVNFPYLGVKYALGEELPPVEIKQGIQVRRRYEETYVDTEDERVLEY